MKTRGLFLSALLMGAVMASCSQDEVMNDASEKSAKNSENYVAVNIVAPGGFGSRGTDGGYADGATGTNVAIDESKVSDAIFVFYDKDGGFVDVTNASLSSWADGTENTVEIIAAKLAEQGVKNIKTLIKLKNFPKNASSTFKIHFYR